MLGEWHSDGRRGPASWDPAAASARVSEVAATRVRALWCHASALFAALVLDPGFMCMGEPTRRLLCGIVAASWILHAHSESDDRPLARERWVAWGVTGAAVATLFFLPLGACGVALAVALLVAARHGDGTLRRAAVAGAWAIAALASWRTLVDFSGLGWDLNSGFAAAWSKVLGTLGGTHVSFGGDFAGLPALLAFAAGAVGGVLSEESDGQRGGRRTIRYAAGQVTLVLVAGTLASVLQLRLLSESPAAGDIGARHLWLFAALAATLFFTPTDRTRATGVLPRLRRPGPATAPCLVIGLCGLLCLGLWLRQETPLVGKRIGLYLGTSTPWQTSATAGYGGTVSATLGDCADLFAALGCRVRHLNGALDAVKLSALDALVVSTPSRAFSRTEQQAVERFVRLGGGLMALAEHTDLAGARRHLQPLLRPFGVAVNNDSALAVAGEPWREAVSVRPHPVLPAATTPDRHGLAIGASLSVTTLARPLLVGRGLFADPATATGDLGDLRYQRPERVGDVVVAATSTPGKGRVLVFGDPSPLMNYPLHSTDAMLRRAVAWLTGGPPSFDRPMILGFALCAGLTLLLTHGQPLRNRVLVALLAAPLAQMLLPTPAVADKVPYPEGSAALIDASHREALATHDAFTSSTAGLARGLRRAGYLPSRLDTFDPEAVSRAGALVLLSPTRDLTPREEPALDGLLARGGTLLLAIGWSEQPPVPRLMRYLRVNVLPTPLGPVNARTPAYEAHFPAAWALRTADPSYRVVCSQWGYPVLLEGRRGAGRILVIGDPAMLLGDHMEGHEQFDPGNIGVFQHLMRRPKATEVAR